MRGDFGYIGLACFNLTPGQGPGHPEPIDGSGAAGVSAAYHAAV
jgi:hypothetical protein